MTYLRARREFVVLTQQFVFSPATGTNAVRLITDETKIVKAKIIQRANELFMLYNKYDPLISTAKQADPRQAHSLENAS